MYSGGDSSSDEPLLELTLDPDSASDDDSDSSDLFEAESSEENSDEAETEPRPSTSTASSRRSRSARRQPRTRSSTRSRRGRGVRSHFPADEDDDDGWIEVDNGEILNIPVFSGQPGMMVIVPGMKTALDYFELFVDQQMIDLMVSETNRYAEQAAQLTPNFYYLKIWKPTDREEMKRFIGVLIAMGIIKKPEIRQFWSTHPILETPFFAKVFTRDRFLAILAFWHLADNNKMHPPGSPGHDKLFKIRVVFDHLSSQFRECYYPQQNLAVDESMMPWRGRVAFRQFIPKKPIRYGMKLYCCCESSSGYICEMKLYTGKEGGSVGAGHGANVVRYVTRAFMGKGHTIYMDSFFSSLALFQSLLQEDTTACGTVLRHRRGNPPSLKSKTLKLAKGEYAVRQKGNVIAMRYQDRKDCMLMSTIHNAAPIRTGKKRRDRLGMTVDEMKPTMVQRYNENMGGVDTLDQKLSYYSFNRKTMKWWKRAATHLIHIAKVQAHILCRKGGKNISQVDFTLELILQLTGESMEAGPSPGPSGDQDPSPEASTSAGPTSSSGQLPTQESSAHEPSRKKRKTTMPLQSQRLQHPDNNHFLDEIPSTGKKLRPTKNCVCCTVYSGRRKQYIHRKETRYQCRACEVPLCVTPCHMVFHTQVDYKRAMRRHREDRSPAESDTSGEDE